MSQDCQNRPPLQPARIHWENGTPVSGQFGDIYFSRDQGVAESSHVFIGRNRLPQRWQQWRQPGSFVIGETGFGTGLNFFCAWALWQQLRQPGQHLHFVSVEKFPLQKNDLEQACNLQPQFAPLAAQLLAQYPPLVPGSHRLHFHAEQLTLTLIFDDAISGFTALDGTVDAWFLDGFSPALNPDMWQADLFTQLARLSHGDTTFATFTAAGVVKRGLRAAGFQVEKCAGHGPKRDMLQGQFTGPAPAAAFSAAMRPWFQFDYRNSAPGSIAQGNIAPRHNSPGNIAIVGGGLAGCNSAYALAVRGWQVTLLEAATEIASRTSGNPTGMTYTRLSLHDSPQNRYYQFAYLHACRFIRALFASHGIAPGQDWNLNGLLQLAFDDKEALAQQQLQAAQLWPEETVQFLDADQVAALTGFSTRHAAMLLRDGGWLNPALLCRTLLAHRNISVRTGHEVQQLRRQGQHWMIDDIAQPFDAVVLANSFDASRFPGGEHLPLRWVRGQITCVPATAASLALTHAVNYDGYLNPARAGVHCIGATFDPRNRDPQELADDHRANLQQLAQTWPAMADALQLPLQQPPQGRVGFRCQTPDYLPLVGPLADPQQFQLAYADIGKGLLKRDFPACPYLPGLYISTAHGSKGITSAALAAEILAAYICGEPQPVDRAVVQALHPARFLLRDIRRRK